MDIENLAISMAEGQEKATQCNTYRIGYSETEILLDFGVLAKQGDTKGFNAVEILSRIALPVEILEHLLMSLFLIGKDYEKEYNRNIGMSLEEEE
ncbi:MAG: hypothetical protein PHC81_02925 [Clostridia bacterium]|nr:hypothetical protein [Clostridia bacterium]